MLRVRGTGKLPTGAGSEDRRWHMGVYKNKMKPMYHTGKNGVKAGMTLT